MLSLSGKEWIESGLSINLYAVGEGKVSIGELEFVMVVPYNFFVVGFIINGGKS